MKVLFVLLAMVILTSCSQNFVFTKEGILFFFPPYQVGPYSSGMFSSVVPFEKLL